MTDERSVEMIISLGAEGWERLRVAITRFADAAGDSGIAYRDVAEAMSRLNFRVTGLTTIEIDPTEAIAALDAKAASSPYRTGCAGCLHYDNNPYLQCAVHPLGRPGEDCGDWAEPELRDYQPIANSPEHEAESERQRLLNPDGRFSPEAIQLSIESPLAPEQAEAIIQEHGLRMAQYVAGNVACGWNINAAMRALGLRSQNNPDELAFSEAEVARVAQECAIRYRYWQAPDGTRHYPTNSPEHEPGGCDRAGA
jgi:hypothetical protein